MSQPTLITSRGFAYLLEERILVSSGQDNSQSSVIIRWSTCLRAHHYE